MQEGAINVLIDGRTEEQIADFAGALRAIGPAHNLKKNWLPSPIAPILGNRLS